MEEEISAKALQDAPPAEPATTHLEKKNAALEPAIEEPTILKHVKTEEQQPLQSPKQVFENLLQERGISTVSPPSRLSVDLWQLFKVVLVSGGSQIITDNKLWATVGRLFNPSPGMTDLSHRIKGIFLEKLALLEAAVDSGEVALPEILLEDLQQTQPILRPASAAEGSKRSRSQRGQAKKRRPASVTARPKPPPPQLKPRPIPPVISPRQPAFDLIGRRVGVWFAQYEIFCYGRVCAYDKSSSIGIVSFDANEIFDDGDVEQVDFSIERWILLDEREIPRADVTGGEVPSTRGTEPEVKIFSAYCGPPSYEIYVSGLEGYWLEDISIKCGLHGELRLSAGKPPTWVKVVSLPSRINAHDAIALFSTAHQLYIRVPIA